MNVKEFLDGYGVKEELDLSDWFLYHSGVDTYYDVTLKMVNEKKMFSSCFNKHNVLLYNGKEIKDTDYKVNKTDLYEFLGESCLKRWYLVKKKTVDGLVLPDVNTKINVEDYFNSSSNKINLSNVRFINTYSGDEYKVLKVDEYEYTLLNLKSYLVWSFESRVKTDNYNFMFTRDEVLAMFEGANVKEWVIKDS